eukprot:m.94369 g.94369  ORF g.94369 m.94369 type:complete len:51 (-) comp8712_c0_seq7:45-197(-)
MFAKMEQNLAKFQQISDPDAVADMLALSAIVIQDFKARRVKACSWQEAES